MSLLKELEDTKKELAEVLEKENQEGEAEESTEETTEEEGQAEEQEAEETQEEEPEDKKEPTNADFARMRREMASLKRELKAEREGKSQVTERPDPEARSNAVMAEMTQEFQLNRAGLEFSSREEEYKRQNPEYEGMANAYKGDLYRSIKIMNPRLSHDQAVRETNRQLLMKASQYVNAGLDPIQEMHEDIKALGYKKQEAREEAEEKQLRPDLRKIAENKKRNAGTVAAKNHGGAELTLGSAAALSPKEWAALPLDQKRRLLGRD